MHVNAFFDLPCRRFVPVTLYKNTKIANAELNREEAICSACEDGPPRGKEMTKEEVTINFQHPLPSELTEKQKEQFLPLVSAYGDVIAQSPNYLGCTEVLHHHVDTKDATPIRP